MTSATFYTLAVVFLAVCLILTLLILIQRGRGGGLSSAFGGAGGNTAFGSKTGDVLTWATAGVFALFVLLSMGLVWSGNAYNEAVTTQTAVTGAEIEEDDEEDDGLELDLDQGGSLPDAPSIPEPGATVNDDNVPGVGVGGGDAEIETMPAELEAPAEDE